MLEVGQYVFNLLHDRRGDAIHGPLKYSLTGLGGKLVFRCFAVLGSALLCVAYFALRCFASLHLLCCVFAALLALLSLRLI